MLTRPYWSEGNYTQTPVANVTVDIYLPTDSPSDISTGSGLYTTTTDSNGMAYFILPDIA